MKMMNLKIIASSTKLLFPHAMLVLRVTTSVCDSRLLNEGAHYNLGGVCMCLDVLDRKKAVWKTTRRTFNYSHQPPLYNLMNINTTIVCQKI